MLPAYDPDVMRFKHVESLAEQAWTKDRSINAPWKSALVGKCDRMDVSTRDHDYFIDNQPAIVYDHDDIFRDYADCQAHGGQNYQMCTVQQFMVYAFLPRLSSLESRARRDFSRDFS